MGEALADPSVVEVHDVAAALGTDVAAGLSSAEVTRRLEEHGPNALDAAPPVPGWRKLLRELRSPLVYLLLAAAAVSLAAWAVEGAEGWPFDAVVILAIVVANAVLGYVQGRRAEDAVAALRRMSAATATVLRDGAPSRVEATAVVPGDVLLLAEGDTVAADARLVTAHALAVAEASLTGESAPVGKDPARLAVARALGDRTDMVFAGTAVTRGTGRAVVTATGMATETGRIARLLESTQAEPTPLQEEIARVGRMLGVCVVVIAVVVVGTVLLVSDLRTWSDAVTVLLLGVSLAVAAVPEGLPAVLTVVLALGVQRMAARNAIVTNLSSVETLGSASVICSDKTGTLTQNAMTVERVVTASGEARLAELLGDDDGGAGKVGSDGGGEVAGREVASGAASGGAASGGAFRREVAAVVCGGSLANDASLRLDEDGRPRVVGDPTDGALLLAEDALGTADGRLGRFRRVAEVPFSSERKLMSVLATDAERGGRVVVVVKGAPDVLLGRCTHELVGRTVEVLDEGGRRRVLDAVERMSGEALRTLGVAYRETDDVDVPAGVADTPEAVEQDLVLAGLVGIIDPPRPEARDAVAAARSAGVRVIMITGDHPRTAGRIARDLGVVGPTSDEVLTGPVLDTLDEAGLREAVRGVGVFARVAPEHKLRIVDALQADDHVVAMTGDGVNDAPALRSADIGVAMGIAGTEVTRQAAAMILADDNFATIVAAVREGRAIFDNVRKFLRYLLSSNIGEVLTVFLGVVLAGVLGLSGHGEVVAIPLLATQILWINLLTDTAPALAMGVDPQSGDVMSRPPRRSTDRVIDRRMWAGVLLTGSVMAAVTLTTIDLYLPGGVISGREDLTTARTAGFTVLVLAQLVNAFCARSETEPVWRGVLSNRWLWGAVGLSLALQVAVVHLPLLNRAFGTAPLDLGQWLTCAGMALLVVVAVELRKVVLRARAGARGSRLG